MKMNSAKYLQGINFLQSAVAEKTEIKNLGCETPDLIISLSSASRKQTYVREFNPVIYVTHKWLSGCAERNTVFCFLCLFFRDDTTRKETLVTDLKRVGEKVKRHGDSVKHVKNKIDLAVLGTLNIASQLCKVYRQQTNIYNETVKINQEILSKIIDCIKFCDKFELLLCGHETVNCQILAFFKDCWNLLESWMNPPIPIS
jgi:hypothetical protein